MASADITKQLARTTKGGYYRALYRAQDIGLLPAETGYTRFLCISTARTGSTLLIRSLNKHKNVIAYGEIVRNQDRFPSHIHQFAGSQTLFEEDPRAFLETRVFRKYPKSIKAVGFKIFYHHAPRDEAWGREVWDYLLSQPELRIIHLKRQNLLRAYISQLKAEQTSQWIKYDASKTRDAQVHVDPAAAIGFFEEGRALEAGCDATLTDHSVLQLYYEDMADDFQGEMERIQRFLRLEVADIQPATKQRPGTPLSGQIENYDELQSALAGTEWESFLEESS
ncbi:MAG: sulfotransferase [Chloroflexota bacterium]